MTETSDEAQSNPLTWQLALAGALVLGAGALHFVYAPTHLSVSRGQGLFFIALGFAQVGWGAIALVTRSPMAYAAGMVGVTWMPALLYAATRFMAAPFAGHEEGIDAIGAATFVGELAGGVLLAWHGISEGIGWTRPDLGQATFALVLVLVGVALAGSLLGGGKLLEGSATWLQEPEASSHEPGAGHAHEPAEPEHTHVHASTVVPFSAASEVFRWH